MIQFHNTLTRKKEEFHPIQHGEVRFYTCGPTVYNFAHIGNFRAYLFEDLLRRFLKFKGFKITQVMNLTDVDDKTIRLSQETGIPLLEYTEKYKQAFFDDLEKLNIEKAEFYPAATGHIDEMVKMIEILLEKDFAYRTEDGSIYFRIEKFSEYGKLAHLSADEMQIGERVESDEYEKEGLRDFALWKGYKAEDDGDVFWETSLGKGRPGWHIECSAMATKYLGNHFDIHTGGTDNIFPHHENEIAQSECATGEQFVNYWLHCEHLLVDNRKMSKSFGNFYRISDILEKGFRPVALRWALLTTHYRQKLNFTLQKMEQSESAVNRIENAVQRVSEYKKDGAGADIQFDEYLSRFENALDDDLNISKALASVFDLIVNVNSALDDEILSSIEREKFVKTMQRFDIVLGVLSDSEDKISDEISRLLEKRSKARAEKDWAFSDEIREQLSNLNVEVKDTPDGQIWKKK